MGNSVCTFKCGTTQTHPVTHTPDAKFAFTHLYKKVTDLYYNHHNNNNNYVYEERCTETHFERDVFSLSYFGEIYIFTFLPRSR